VRKTNGGGESREGPSQQKPTCEKILRISAAHEGARVSPRAREHSRQDLGSGMTEKRKRQRQALKNREKMGKSVCCKNKTRRRHPGNVWGGNSEVQRSKKVQSSGKRRHNKKKKKRNQEVNQEKGGNQYRKGGTCSNQKMGMSRRRRVKKHLGRGMVCRRKGSSRFLKNRGTRRLKGGRANHTKGK